MEEEFDAVYPSRLGERLGGIRGSESMGRFVEVIASKVTR